MYIWKIDVSREGDRNVLSSFNLIAPDIIQAGYIADHYVYEKKMFPDFTVDIVGVTKVQIGKILNAIIDDEEEEFDPQIILNVAKNMPDEDVLVFNHNHNGCQQVLRVPIGNWDYTVCPTCDEDIYRREVKDVGGLVFYEYIDELHKK